MELDYDPYIVSVLKRLDELERRVDMIGRNGNDGAHYVVADANTPTDKPVYCPSSNHALEGDDSE